MTVGEKIVRTEFNPSQLDIVSQIKQKSAELINLCIDVQKQNMDKQLKIIQTSDMNSSDRRSELENQVDESMRLVQKAMEVYEEAAMWAVKAATVTIK